MKRMFFLLLTTVVSSFAGGDSVGLIFGQNYIGIRFENMSYDISTDDYWHVGYFFSAGQKNLAPDYENLELEYNRFIEGGFKSHGRGEWGYVDIEVSARGGFKHGKTITMTDDGNGIICEVDFANKHCFGFVGQSGAGGIISGGKSLGRGFYLGAQAVFPYYYKKKSPADPWFWDCDYSEVTEARPASFFPSVAFYKKYGPLSVFANIPFSWNTGRSEYVKQAEMFMPGVEIVWGKEVNDAIYEVICFYRTDYHGDNRIGCQLNLHLMFSGHQNKKQWWQGW